MILSLRAVRARAACLGRPNRPSRHAPKPRIATYFAVWQQRRALALLPPERLIDLGIPPAEAAAEIARPFWDVP